MATFVERAIGAARLDAATYEEVEADPSVLGQAMAVVVIASLASGLGSSLAGGGQGASVLGGMAFSVVGYTSTGRSVGVCSIGFAAYLLIAIVLAGLLVGTGIAPAS